MKEAKFFKSLITVMVSNSLLLISQILVGLILPKILNVDGFGNYRIFMLYGTYASLLHFGFVDGILVKYGGDSLESIDRKNMSQLFTFFIFLEFIVAIVIELTALVFFDGKYKLIFSAVGIYTFFLNMETAFQFLSQAVMKFGLVARMNHMQSFFNTVNILIPSLFIFILHFFKSLNYLTYIILYINAYVLLFIIYVYIYSVKYKIVKLNINFDKNKIFEIFRIGFPITIASQIGNITLNMDNQFVSIFFKTATFARYSFSYNLISLTISIVLAISTVLFPYLNRETKDDLIKNYSKNMSFMLLFIYSTLFSYYPVELIIKLVLSQYTGSLVYFRILLPGVAITTSISTIIFNHYKVTGDMKLYLRNGIIALVLSLILYSISYILFKNVIVLAFASLVALFIWFFIEDFAFRKKYDIKRYKDYIYIILCTLAFQISTGIPNVFFSIISYALVYLILSYIFEGNYLRLLYRYLVLFKQRG